MYRINWAEWLKESRWESVEGLNFFASFPYGFLMSRIIVDSLVDLSMFTPSLINATYDSHTFPSMEYVKNGKKWVKKDSLKARADSPKRSKISADSATILFQDNEEVKTRLLTVEWKLKTFPDAVKGIFLT